jgi:hypothetical protein
MTSEQELRLIAAMRAANAPLVTGLDAVNAHLKELNGKVANHQALHAASNQWQQGFQDRFEALERRSGEERREHPPSGENRTISKWDVVVAMGGISVGAGLVLWLLKLVGKI